MPNSVGILKLCSVLGRSVLILTIVRLVHGVGHFGGTRAGLILIKLFSMKRLKAVWVYFLLAFLVSCADPSFLTIGTRFDIPLGNHPPRPGDGFLWIEGDWFWNGSTYLWRDGYWSHPSPGYQWRPGEWRDKRGGYYWRPGEWRRRR
jgi:hypothetical protein